MNQLSKALKKISLEDSPKKKPAPRSLTLKEIEFILDFIKPLKALPSETANSIVEIQKKPLRAQLEKVKIYPELINTLKARVQSDFISTLIQPGESVGVVAAQSIGEKNTQSTLNVFHLCGQGEKTVTQGVPRMNELLQVPQQPKIVNSKIYFKSNTTTIQELRNMVKSQFNSLMLKQIAKSYEICLNKETEKWYDLYYSIYDKKKPENYKHCISVKLKAELVYKNRLSLTDIALVFENNFDDLFCIVSPLTEMQIDIFIDTNAISFEEENLLFITKDNYESIYLEEKVLPTLLQFNICGLQGIKNIFYTVDNGEWFLETEGTNFIQLLGHPLVDYKRTTSNNVWDIYNQLGIEAARYFLINEFQQVLGDVNLCHISLLVDKQTFTGTIRPISRYTLKKDNCGVMSKASFEESVDIYLNSAFSGESDKLKGVSASVICGKRASIGTGMMELKVDLNALL